MENQINNSAAKKMEQEKLEREALEKMEQEKLEREALEKIERENTINSKAEIKTSLAKALQPFIKRYPKNKEFFVSSDGQVFLEQNKSSAIYHQKSLKNGELQNFKVK